MIEQEPLSTEYSDTSKKICQYDKHYCEWERMMACTVTWEHASFLETLFMDACKELADSHLYFWTKGYAKRSSKDPLTAKLKCQITANCP